MNDAEQRVVKKGDSIELEIESLAFGGKGVAKVDGLAIFVERTIPGQKVLARIVKKKKKFCRSLSPGISEKSPQRN